MKNRIPALVALALVTLTPGAAAQAVTILEYNAGLAGSPGTAASPASQGWNFAGGGASPSTSGLSPDGNTGRNAWQVRDLSTAIGSTGRYSNLLTATELADADQFGFRVDVDARMLASGAAPSINFEFFDGPGPGAKRYLVYMQVSGLDVVLEPWGGVPRACPLAMDGEYHRFSILHQPGASLAELLYDGHPLGNFAPFNGSTGLPQGGVAFGAGSSGGTGTANFHRVQFGVLRPNAGNTFCSPANPNSTGEPAVIQATGTTLAAANDLVLYATKLPPNQFGFFVNGLQPAYVPNPGGSRGILCLGGTLGRYVAQIQNSGPFGEMSITLDLTQTPTGSGLVSILGGQTWMFQAWFRDNHPNPTSNFTNGTRVQFL